MSYGKLLYSLSERCNVAVGITTHLVNRQTGDIVLRSVHSAYSIKEWIADSVFLNFVKPTVSLCFFTDEEEEEERSTNVVETDFDFQDFTQRFVLLFTL